MIDRRGPVAFRSARVEQLLSERRVEADDESLGTVAARALARYYDLINLDEGPELAPADAAVLVNVLRFERATFAEHTHRVWVPVHEAGYLELADWIRQLNPLSQLALIDSLERYWAADDPEIGGFCEELAREVGLI